MFRYTLGFGKVSKLLGYNALKDFFPRSTIRPNPECPNEFCRKHQQRVKKEEEERKKLGIVKETEKVIPKHSENTWGMLMCFLFLFSFSSLSFPFLLFFRLKK